MGCGATKPKEQPAQPEPVKEEGPSEEEKELASQKLAEEDAQRKKEDEDRKAAEEAAEEERKAQEKEEAAEAGRKKEEEAKRAAEKAEAEKKQRGPLTCVISGPPGSIKGKLSEHIVKNFGVKHVSTGEAFRDAVKSQTPAGLRAKQAHKDTGQVPDDLHLEIVKEVLVGEAAGRQGWLLDGFPKTFEAAAGLEAAGVELQRLVLVAISDDDLVRRAVGRRIDPVTHQLYHMEGLGFPEPPADEEVRNRLQQRNDDAEERVRTRLQQYRDTHLDLSSVFGKVLQVDGTKDVDDLKAEIEAFLA